MGEFIRPIRLALDAVYFFLLFSFFYRRSQCGRGCLYFATRPCRIVHVPGRDLLSAS